MKTYDESKITFLPDAVHEKAFGRVDECLNSIVTDGNSFLINDVLHFREQRTGRISNCVMNSATFISSKFQSKLDSYVDSNGETTIDGQAIDGFIEIPYEGVGYNIKDKNKLLQVIHGYIEDRGLPSSSVYTLFPMFYGMYVERNIYSIEGLPPAFSSFFDSKEVDSKFRIGVEFETGNIASSFRAINKLFILFQKREIDAGVFITSIDKPNSATRIWPVSNRNGSFQELISRNYQEQVSLPLVCVGFSPDSFSKDAPFLGKNGETYQIKPTGRLHASGEYEVYLGEEGEEILKPT